MISYQSIHFVGVLTPEMASLALYTAKHKIRVSASCENSQSIYLEPLREAGITVFEMYAQVNIAKHVELIVLSRYYDMRHIEADAALKLKIPVISEIDYIQLITEGKQLIALLGEYESRLSATFLAEIYSAGHIPAHSLTATIPVGTHSISLAQMMESEWFILPLVGFKRDATTYEADFLSFDAQIAGIPSLRFDYPELNTTLDDVYQSHYAFAKRIPRRGMIVGNSDYSRMKRLRGHLADRHIETFGGDRDALWHIEEEVHTPRGIEFSLKNGREQYGPFEIPAYSRAAISAAATAIIIALDQDIRLETIMSACKLMPPLRRFGETNTDSVGRVIIDDQADHPELISDFLDSLRVRYPSKKIWCLYQAGSYLRVKARFQELGQALAKADFVYLSPIIGYPREKTEGIDIRHLVSDMKRFHSQTYFFEDSAMMSNLLSHRVTSTDCVITLGIEGLCQQATAPMINFKTS